MWGNIRNAARKILKPWNLLSAFFFVFGLAGAPDDYDTWVAWIGQATESAPFLFHWAVEVVTAALLLPYAQFVALILALAILLRAGIKRRLETLRNKVGLVVAEALNETRFISRQDAIKRVRESRWARSRYRMSEKPISLYDRVIAGATSLTVDPAKNERQAQFAYWCSMALDAFEAQCVGSVRNEDGKREYDEVVLVAWLVEKYDDDVIDQFGPI